MSQSVLSRKQFDMIPTKEVGYMASADWGGTVEKSYQAARTLGEGGSKFSYEQQNLNDDVSAHGIHTPIEVGPGNSLKDGHHRYYATRALGVKEMPYRVVP